MNLSSKIGFALFPKFSLRLLAVDRLLQNFFADLATCSALFPPGHALTNVTGVRVKNLAAAFRAFADGLAMPVKWQPSRRLLGCGILFGFEHARDEFETDLAFFVREERLEFASGFLGNKTFEEISFAFGEELLHLVG